MRITLLMCLIGASLSLPALGADPETGFKPIFDGKSLEGWKGDSQFWKAADGAIVGESTSGNPLKENTFLVWDRGDVDDFELRLKFRISGTPAANSGIQFRGTVREDGHVIGYQADLDRSGTYLGTLYDEAARGGLAGRGENVVITEQGKKQPQKVADAAKLLSKVNLDDWNEYSILARGNQITLKINGVVTAEVTDNDPAGLDRIGKLALQLHAGPPMKIEFRDIRLKRLPLTDGWKKVVFIAGKPSHAYFSHEHNAGCLLLAKSLNTAQREQGLKVLSTVSLNGWPQDVTALDNADTVVAYCDGGARHFLNEHLDEFDEVASRGVGLVCLHYGVETVIGKPGEYFLKWIGGYFEPYWSVNPHWTARFDTFPDHPISRGVQPFEINDEWYYHMRFVKDMKGVTPILTALPPNESLSRPDGPHSGNPAVRAAVIERHEPQHVAWAYDRTDGKGRGFGFTGGHNHVNWQHDDFRKLVLNAIVWTAHLEVPEQGVISPTPTQNEMLENQDEPPPAGFKFQPAPRKPLTPPPSRKTSAVPEEGPAAPLFFSPVITPDTPGHAIRINADITAARSLFLVVTDGGDGITCDWADWIEPRLMVDPARPEQGELSLTQLKWKRASSGWGNTQVNSNAEGGPLRVQDRAVKGIGTHSPSLIEFELPAGHPYTRFVAQGGIDHGGARQGPAASVRFAVFTEPPPSSFLQGASAPANHEASHALETLEVGTGLQVSLFASEPLITNPASIDIDHLGRVWVCEAVNYRPFANQDVIGQRGPDRIVVLEDTDGDARADRSTVFFSGPEVDSAHGVLVLPTPDGKGSRALISAGDQVFYLIDENGDLQADRKEVLFTGIGGKQHDHGIHAFHFGPDGKLYFNFGNYGKSINDRNGHPIVDRSGHQVVSNRRPYQEGMVFRCNPDGSEFETLAWNFRNNWEVCVDSFGTLWQSDNDDDGNRGVRINYVMEYGNYGYKDELTGASWQTPRTGQESEIPQRHWHLNDPGVIPNFLQTGAGAPTGICLYEGDLLPDKFRHAPIHCDAGTNICRAYLPTPSGAGYTGTVVNILSGARNQWFRPSDVCVAPDGSLMIADWYDPGVGGHRMMDIAHGRIYRIAPDQSKYISPKVDVSTPAGAALALQSPNMATRSLGWDALMALGSEAESALIAMRNSSRPEWQARAIWALGKLQLDHTRRLKHLKSGLTDSNPDLRVCSIRLLRQLMQEVTFEESHRSLSITDPSPAVRREFLIAMRELNPEWIPAVEGKDFMARSWSRLASQYDGHDRWFLEALGIAAEGHWDAYLTEWMKNSSDAWKESPAGRDLVWRSRGQQTPRLLATLILQPQASDDDVLRYFRSFDFQSGPEKQAALETLAFSTSALEESRQRRIRLEALNRLEAGSIQNDPHKLKVIESLVADLQGTSTGIQLISRFQLKNHDSELLELARSQPSSQLAADAIKALFDGQNQSLIFSAIQDNERGISEQVLAALGTAGDPRSQAPLIQLMQDESRPLWLRQGAVRALATTAAGGKYLLELTTSKACPSALQQTVAAALTTHSLPAIRAQALQLFPPPPGKDSTPLPPIPELATRKGDVDRGRIIFNTTGTCNKCHQVNGIGQEIGPNLSEAGKKLPKQALLEAILFPSAAISHGFENWLIATEDGQLYTGLLVNETAAEITLRDDKGIVRTIPVSKIDVRKKQDVSLMPADLQKLMTVEELVDLTEYLTTLRERRL